VNDLRLQMSVRFDRQDSDCDWKLKAPWAAGARVEVEHAFFRDEIRDVGVAVEDGGKFGCRGIEVQGFEVVQHIDVEAGVGRVFDEDDFGFGQLAAEAFSVDVATNRCDGSDLSEFVEDGWFADVAEMKNAVDALESGSNFRAEEAVGVGDDAEEHGVRISGVAELERAPGPLRANSRKKVAPKPHLSPVKAV
jgi:predicted Rdx family selenoprotein